MENKNWFALEILVAAEAAEAVEFALNELDTPGTEINNLGVSSSETLTVIGYFNQQIDDDKVNLQLNEALKIYGFSPHSIEKTGWRKIENADWLAEWKKHWKPTETGKFIVAPPWEKVENAEKIVIRIEPNMAFGTGTHETTRLCLEAIGDYYKSGMSFLDVGTGTGILAIAAAKSKVQSPEYKNNTYENQINSELGVWDLELISACDTDADSITIARENVKLNEVGGKIGFHVGSISDETPKFDFICANLTLDVIAPILPILLEKSKRVLILSGILKEQESSIVSQLKTSGVEKAEIKTLGEWISVLIEK